MAIDPSRLASYLDNTAFGADFEDQGILKFLRECFPDRFDHPFAEHHYLMTKVFWEMFRPGKVNRFERQGYFVIHREAAKTTLATFGLPQYLIWLRGHSPWVRYEAEGWAGADVHDYEIVKLEPIKENLIVICSETSRQSEFFVGNIKDTIDTRKDLAKLFGEKNPKAFATELKEAGYETEGIEKNKWTNDAFITSDGTVVVGRGAGQQIRGLNIRGSRPTTIFVDDMYSRNNTRTETRLEDLNRWFYAELSNSLDGGKGKMFFLGTVVHDQTVIKDILNSDQWFGLERPIIHYEELQQVLKNHCTINDTEVQIPSLNKCNEIQKGLKTLSWPQRQNLYYILNIYKREFEQHRIGYFYQEYLNITQAPEEAKFSREKLKPISIRYEEGLMTFEWEGKQWWTVPNTHMAVDLASSESRTADDTVIACAGLYRCKAWAHGKSEVEEMIVPIIPWMTGGRGWGTYADSRDNMYRKGVVEEIFKVLHDHPCDDVTIETNAQQIQTWREVDKTLWEKRWPGQVHKYNSQGKKNDRIIAILEAIWKYPVIFYNNQCMKEIDKMFSQLLMLGPVETKDDWPDGLSIAFTKSSINPLDFAIPGAGDSRIIDTANEETWRERSKRLGSGRWEVF